MCISKRKYACETEFMSMQGHGVFERVTRGVVGLRGVPDDSGHGGEDDEEFENDLLVGSQDPFFWFMVPLIGLVCIGAVCSLTSMCRPFS
ncbi:GPI inositol deacylase [Ciborinia camelliae]|nr:GPI inositol deacylase [Ciborinia camelliae]